MSDQPIVYLDNAATTFPKPEVVYREMDSFYRNYGGNAGRGANPLARRAAKLVNETRTMLQDWLNALEVTFTPSATIALNTVIFGADLRPGDVVYITPYEHNSVLRPLEYLRKTVGIIVRTLPFDKRTSSCNLDQVRALFRIDPPTMICVTQISNVFGIALPVDEIVTLARQASPSIIVLVDGAQGAGLKPLKMPEIDALVFSGHKSLYAPYGVAGIGFGRHWRPKPFIYGGTGTQSESIEMPSEGPSRYEAGSLNISAIAGLHAALCWLNEEGREAVNSHIQALSLKLHILLSEVPGLIDYGATQDRLSTGIVSINIRNLSPQQVEAALGAKNIAVRAGFHCAPSAHEFVGTISSGGTIRISLGRFNKYSDIEYLAKNLITLTES